MQTLRQAAGFFGLMLLTLSPATAAPVRMACTVTGAKLMVPEMSPDAACARLRAAVGAAGSIAIQAIAKAPVANTDRSGWFSVDLYLTKPGVMTARIVDARSGRIVTHPDVSIAVMDRPLTVQTLDMMAREIANRLAMKPKAG